MNQILRVTAIFLLTLSIARAQDFVFSGINVQDGLSDNQVRYIIQLPDGRMVFKTSGNINIYNGAQFKYIHQNAQHVYPLAGYNGFYRIYQSGDSVLWIKDHHKLMCVDLCSEKYLSNLDAVFRKMGFQQHIDDVFMDSGKRLWILSGGKLSLKDSSLSFNVSANSGIIQDLAADKQNLYLFYNTGTVTCYDLSTKKKRYSADAYRGTQQMMFGNTSLVVEGKGGFYQLRNGSMGGFFFFNIQERRWKKIMETSYTLNTLFVDGEGVASISCTNGIWIVDVGKNKKRYLPILKKTDGHSLNTEISTLFYDKQGGLWLGTLNQGLLYYHPSRFTFTHVGRPYFLGNSLKDLVVHSFAEDHSGNIYLNCQSEYYKYDRNTKDHISLKAVSANALPQTVIQKFAQNPSAGHYGPDSTTGLIDIRGWRWKGTADGLKVFNSHSGKEQTFYTSDGLSNNFIHAILQDRQNNIWISTSYGINKVQVNARNGKINFTSFGPEAGTLAEEYADRSAFEGTDGTLYFGGINGFSKLEPQRRLPKNLPFRPLFSNFFLHGEKIEPGRAYNDRIILKESAAYTRQIELSYDQNFLTFEFSALNYRNSAQTYYRYQLDGIDQDWRETVAKGTNRSMENGGLLTLSYTNLPHGKYKLRVMSSNTNHDWNVPATVVELTIHAPWWKTTMAYVLFAILSLSIVLAIIFNYMRSARNKMEQKHREDILLLRIRNLIEQQNSLHTEKEIHLSPSDTDISHPARNHHQSQADSAFLARALLQVENNLQVPNYSVEQLSRDLHMDRTGLYRKLTALMDKSPSLFIRNVRLEKAAALILEGQLNISEITEKVGFSSSSYLSKCFQERYGCRPSEYVEKAKKST